jgi:hypothetical protein
MKMKRLLSFLLFTILTPAVSLFAADPLDFPDATFRIKIGSQTMVFHANAQAKEIKIDGKSVKVGEVISNSTKIDWLVAPSAEVGDEYVFVVYRPKQNPKTYSAVFKSGYLSVMSQDELSIEIEN